MADHDSGKISTSAAVGASDSYPTWLDGFPHGFHGWGPNAPDHDHVEAEKKKPTAETVPPITFLRMTVMSAADPFATDLIWRHRN